MPAFIIASADNVVICDPNAVGQPDRKSGVPVRATITDQTITIDDEVRPRSIISAVNENGRTTYLVDGSTNQILNRNRRIALKQASMLLRQLRDSLRPLTAASEEPDYVSESLQLLFDWLAKERNRLTRRKVKDDDDA